MFEYLIYRFYIAFEDRHKGTVNSLLLASLALVILVFLILYSLYYLIYYLSTGTIFINSIQINKIYIKILFVITVVIITFICYYYFKKRINKITVKHKRNKLNNIIKIWMVFLFAVFLFLSPVLWKYLFSFS